MIYSRVLATAASDTFDTNDDYFQTAFQTERPDSMVRVSIALESGSASTTVAVYDSAGGEIRLNNNVAIDALRTYSEDIYLPPGRSFNIRAKADGVLLNHIRVLELFPPAF